MEPSIDTARQAWMKNKPDLVINEVPEPTLDKFKKLAEEQFKNKQGFAHYGYTLKLCVDAYEELTKTKEALLLIDMCVPKNLELEGRVMLLEEEIEKLKEIPKKATIRLGTGKVIPLNRS